MNRYSYEHEGTRPNTAFYIYDRTLSRVQHIARCPERAVAEMIVDALNNKVDVEHLLDEINRLSYRVQWAEALRPAPAHPHNGLGSSVPGGIG